MCLGACLLISALQPVSIITTVRRHSLTTMAAAQFVCCALPADAEFTEDLAVRALECQRPGQKGCACVACQAIKDLISHLDADFTLTRPCTLPLQDGGQTVVQTRMRLRPAGSLAGLMRGGARDGLHTAEDEKAAFGMLKTDMVQGLGWNLKFQRPRLGAVVAPPPEAEEAGLVLQKDMWQLLEYPGTKTAQGLRAWRDYSYNFAPFPVISKDDITDEYIEKLRKLTATGQDLGAFKARQWLQDGGRAERAGRYLGNQKPTSL